MRNKREIYPILSILLVGLVGIIILLIYLWNKPLGPSLQLPTRTSEGGSNHNPLSLEGRTTGEPEIEPGVEAAEQTQPEVAAQNNPNSEPVCGGPSVMTILLIGSDYRGDGFTYGLADAIRIVRIDFTIPSVVILDFPRDLWVEIPGISDHYGRTNGKLNQAYFYGTRGMGYYDGPGEGPGLLARTLDLNFNLPVDHYLTVKMSTLSKLVNAVGGVEITFNTEVDLNAVIGPTYPELILPAGTYHVNGELAIHLVTGRRISTFQRTRFQNMLIFALRDKLLSTEMLPKMPGLVVDMIGDFQTDLSINDINKLICLSSLVNAENLNTLSFPEELFTPSSIYDPYRALNTFIYQVDFEELRYYVAEFMNGNWSAP